MAVQRVVAFRPNFLCQRRIPPRGPALALRVGCFAGDAVTLPTGAPVAWQQTSGTAGLFEVEWEGRAAAFAALGHPVRLELLRHILSGIHATAELASLESLGTTGQLHHHLRQLLSSGWLKQSGRGSYEVPPARMVPLLACLIAAEG